MSAQDKNMFIPSNQNNLNKEGTDNMNNMNTQNDFIPIQDNPEKEQPDGVQRFLSENINILSRPIPAPDWEVTSHDKMLIDGTSLVQEDMKTQKPTSYESETIRDALTGTPELAKIHTLENDPTQRGRETEVKEKYRTCLECGRTISKQNMKRHKNRAHKNTEKAFHKNRNYPEREIERTNPSKICEICGQTVSKQNMKRHKYLVHKGIDDLNNPEREIERTNPSKICEICDKPISKMNMKRHKLLVHRETRKSVQKDLMSPKDIRLEDAESLLNSMKHTHPTDKDGKEDDSAIIGDMLDMASDGFSGVSIEQLLSDPSDQLDNLNYDFDTVYGLNASSTHANRMDNRMNFTDGNQHDEKPKENNVQQPHIEQAEEEVAKHSGGNEDQSWQILRPELRRKARTKAVTSIAATVNTLNKTTSNGRLIGQIDGAYTPES